jgi:hypothetical protein
VSSKTPWDSFRICTSTELRDEREVDEADWTGESEGVAAVELVEATDCWVVFLLRFGLEPESAVVDMMANGVVVNWKRTARSKMLKSVAICFFPAIVDPQAGGGQDTFCWDRSVGGVGGHRAMAGKRRIAGGREQRTALGLIRAGRWSCQSDTALCWTWPILWQRHNVSSHQKCYQISEWS